MCVEMSHIRNDLNHKISEIGRLQKELSKRDNSEAENLVESLKQAISSLEKENSSLKVNTILFYNYCIWLNAPNGNYSSMLIWFCMKLPF